MKPTWWLATLALLAGPTLAQDKVYRCGPDGRSYSATPCPGGREVDVTDPRSEGQQRAAQDLARREAAMAEGLRRERQHRERERAKGAARLDAPAPAASAPKAKKPVKKRKTSRRAVHDPAEDGVREAIGPAPPRKR